jgi:hypothetical protein
MNPVAAAALDLRDIHAAPPPPLWPPAPGWWILAVVLLAVLTMLAVWAYRRYRVYRQKSKILHEIEQLSDGYKNKNSAIFIAEISMLLRRVALRRYDRTQVAPLTGAAWLRFLDDTGGDGQFENGVGRILEVGPYQPCPGDVPAAELLVLTRQWISKNLGAAA